MAIGNPAQTPNVGVRGNPQELPQLQQKESTQATSSPVNYVSALSNLALTPTALGSLATNLLTSSSNALMEKWGYEQGKNPHGDVLPAITDADKHFNQAYSNQAQATLGLNAQKMFSDAQIELNKSYKLTPDLIKSYSESMLKGTQNILEQAPTSVKPALEVSLQSTLLRTSTQLTEKMIGQQKEDARQKLSIDSINQTKNIYESAMSGQPEVARSLYENEEKRNRQQRETGMITRAEEERRNETNRQTMLTGYYSNLAMEAKKSGSEEKFLASLANKPDAVSFSDWSSVTSNVLKNIGQVEALENRNYALTLAQGQQDIQTGIIGSKIDYYRENLRPIQFTQLMTAYASSLKKTGKLNADVQRITSDPSNPTVYAGQSPKIINASFDQLVSAQMQASEKAGQPISQDEAEYQIASNMSSVVPKYVDKLNRQLQSGNPQQMLSAINQYEQLHSLQGNKVLGINEKSLAMAEVFQDLLDSNPGDPVGAANQAKDIVFNKDETILKLNQQKINEFMNKNASNSSRLLSTAVKIGGAADDSIDRPEVYTADVFGRFKGFMQLTNGDVEQSQRLTKKSMDKVWGTTYVNGKQQTARYPIEHIIGIEQGATPLIQEDIVNQLQPQLNYGKEAFDKGLSPHYFRLKERVTYDQYAEAKEKIAQFMSAGSITKLSRGNESVEELTGQSSFSKAYNSLKPEREIIKEYEAGKPIEIEQVLRNGQTKTFKIEMQTSSYAQVSPKDGSLLGGVNVTIRDPDTGINSFIHGYFGPTRDLPEYHPDKKYINDRLLGLLGVNQHSFEQLKALKEGKYKQFRNIFAQPE
jgi:hypothetical protein